MWIIGKSLVPKRTRWYTHYTFYSIKCKYFLMTKYKAHKWGKVLFGTFSGPSQKQARLS